MDYCLKCDLWKSLLDGLCLDCYRKDKLSITDEDLLNNQIEKVRQKYGNAIHLKNKIKYSANHKEIVSFSQKDYYTIEWMLKLAMKELKRWEDKV